MSQASTTVPDPPAATADSRPAERYSIGRLMGLQLAPGIASLVAYTAFAAITTRQGLPSILALLVAIVVAETPLTWWLIVRRTREETGNRFRWRQAFPWDDPFPHRLYLLVGLPLVVFSLIMTAAVSPLLESSLVPLLFAWLPDWFVLTTDPSALSTLGRGGALALWALSFVALLGGGFTQEIYARGFLLPRSDWMGGWAPPFNALLFAVFHLVAPWAWPAFFVMVLPWAYAVWRLRSYRIGLFIHLGMLLIQWLMMSLLLFGVVPPTPA